MLNHYSSQVLSFPISFCIRSVVPSTLSSTFHQNFYYLIRRFFFSNILQLSICDGTINYIYCLQILFVPVLIFCFCLHPTCDNLPFFISEKWPSAVEQRPTCSETVLLSREGLECAPFDLIRATAPAG